MAMRIGRTLSPAAAPFTLKEIASGVAGLFKGQGTVTAFEDELKAFHKVNYCFSVSSGKAALVLILQVLHALHPDKDEVLIPAYTCYSVPSAIINAGLKVRLCDMEPGTLDFDFALMESELDNPGLLCVIPTHMFGIPADVERVKSHAGRRGIFVIEDAAQAMGGEWHGKKAGTLGDVGLFSLGRGKAFSTVEGGVILTDNEQIGQLLEKRLAELKGYGSFDCLKLILNAVALSILIYPCIYWLPKSLPFLKLGKTHFMPVFSIMRMSPFQAGMTKKWETTLNKLKGARLVNAKKIAAHGIKAPGICREKIPALIRYPVLVSDAHVKRKILKKSEILGLGISDGYPDSIDGIEDLSLFLAGNLFPVAKDIAARIITLPIHSFVRNDDVRDIIHLLKEGGIDLIPLPAAGDYYR